jgi:hypothetical protein
MLSRTYDAPSLYELSNTNWSRTVKAASFFTTPSPSSGAAPCTVRWSCWIDAQTAEEDDLMYPPFEDEDEGVELKCIQTGRIFEIPT